MVENLFLFLIYNCSVEMVDSYIMSLAHSIEVYAGYTGAAEKEEEWNFYLLGQYFVEYR